MTYATRPDPRTSELQSAIRGRFPRGTAVAASLLAALGCSDGSGSSLPPGFDSGNPAANQDSSTPNPTDSGTGGLDSGGNGSSEGGFSTDAGPSDGGPGEEAGRGADGGGAEAGTGSDAGGMPEAGPGLDGGAALDGGSDGGMTLDAGSDGGLDAGLDAGPDGGSDAGFDAGADAGDPGTTFPSVDDFAARGPFETTSTNNTDVGCTFFRPSNLGQDGLDHPVIVWGNGTFTAFLGGPQAYQEVLDHWASHGFIVAAANTDAAGNGEAMTACLDHVIAQHNGSGTPYAGNVDTDHIGVSGHSQGGGGALMVGQDARVTVTAPLQPYTAQGFGGYDQASIDNQQGPMFLMSGGADTVASRTPHQSRVFNGTNVDTVWGTLAGADHVSSATGNINGFRGPATAWFRFHLMNDQSAESMFYGSGCGLCDDSDWTVERNF